jgi:hypothetical protein
MQRSSNKIGTLAAALAKAQAEIINPEKSLTAPSSRRSARGQRTFRYAPIHEASTSSANAWAGMGLRQSKHRDRSGYRPDPT